MTTSARTYHLQRIRFLKEPASGHIQSKREDNLRRFVHCNLPLEIINLGERDACMVEVGNA